MTKIFNYDQLTWPEIASLPRNTPLIIPLGQGYSILPLIEALDSPPKIGILPALPFGWRGSGLEVSDNLLADLLRNLVNSLREDGFSKIFTLTPQELYLDLGALSLCLPHSSQFSTQPLIPPDQTREKVILIPIGHTEQHAYHLPMSTDTIIIDAISRGAVESVPELAYSLPVMPYGVSTHRSAFAGTLNCGGRAFENFWIEIIDRLVMRGFSKFYFLSGHGGNCSFLVTVVKYSGERHRQTFCATSWLYLSGPHGIQAINQYRDSKIGGMGHACELETSFILHLQPSQVNMDLVIDEVDFIATPSYFMDWVDSGALVANPPWDDDTKTGAYGAGSLGSAEKGMLWLRAAIEEKINHIEEIHEQHARRNARRASGYGLWGKKL